MQKFVAGITTNAPVLKKVGPPTPSPKYHINPSNSINVQWLWGLPAPSRYILGWPGHAWPCADLVPLEEKLLDVVSWRQWPQSHRSQSAWKCKDVVLPMHKTQGTNPIFISVRTEAMLLFGEIIFFWRGRASSVNLCRKWTLLFCISQRNNKKRTPYTLILPRKWRRRLINQNFSLNSYCAELN